METILIADDHEIIRMGIHSIIKRFPGEYRIIEADSCAAVKQIFASQPVQYAILDIMLADGNLFLFPDIILDHCQQTSILVYSAIVEKLYAERLLRKGIRGYLCKQANLEELQEAIHAILKNEVYLSTGLKDILWKSPGAYPADPVDKLSDRELAVAECIIAGYAVQEIALQLSLDISTISTFKRRLFKKWKCRM